MRSERVNLLVTPDEKAVIDQCARDAGLTTSEMIRRATFSFELRSDEEVRLLVDELAGAIERLETRLDLTQKRFVDFEQQLADREQLRQMARREIEASGAVWPFTLSEADETSKATA